MLKLSRTTCMLAKLCVQAKTLMHQADACACPQGQAEACFISAQACCLLQVSFIPANKLDQAAEQKPAQSGPSSDQQNSSHQHKDRQPQSSGADSPHSDRKRKRDSHRDRVADGDSKRYHSTSDLPDHDSEQERQHRHRHRHTGKDDRGHKDSKRRHRDPDDAQISGRDDRLGDRRGSKAKTGVWGDRNDMAVSSTEEQAAAAGSVEQDSGWVTFTMQLLHHACRSSCEKFSSCKQFSMQLFLADANAQLCNLQHSSHIAAACSAASLFVIKAQGQTHAPYLSSAQALDSNLSCAYLAQAASTSCTSRHGSCAGHCS